MLYTGNNSSSSDRLCYEKELLVKMQGGYYGVINYDVVHNYY